MYYIAKAELEHITDIAPLFDKYRIFYGQESDLKSAERFLTERLNKNESVIFIAQHQASKEILGFIQLFPSFSSVSLASIWILNDLFVVPKARRQGIASALLSQARNFAVENGSARLTLETAPDNYSAQATYEKLGWNRSEFLNYQLPI